MDSTEEYDPEIAKLSDRALDRLAKGRLFEQVINPGNPHLLPEQGIIMVGTQLTIAGLAQRERIRRINAKENKPTARTLLGKLLGGLK